MPLAVDGCEVTVVDSSANALAVLRSRARDAGVADQVRAVQGDVDALADIDGHVGADLVLGHGLLEYVDDPASAVRALAAATAPGGAVSVLVAGRWAAVLGRVVAGRVAEARRLLADPAGRWGRGDPMLRRMDTDEIRELIERDGALVVEQVRGHRVLADLVPETPTAASRPPTSPRSRSSPPTRRRCATSRHASTSWPGAPLSGDRHAAATLRTEMIAARRGVALLTGRKNDRRRNTPVRVVGVPDGSYDECQPSR